MTTPLRIDLDELPRYSPWPARLLRSSDEPLRSKTLAEVIREFDTDKWGQLVALAEAGRGYSIDVLEEAEAAGDTVQPFFEDGGIFLATVRHSRMRHLQRLREALAPYVANASCLVELGAGYGAKLFRLARLPEFSSLQLMAAELTATGRELLRRVAAQAGLDVVVAACDLSAGTIDRRIPSRALVFTSYALHYVPVLPRGLPSWLASFDPVAVVHCEPCLEHYSSRSLHDLLCAAYVQVNDYSRNIASVLEAAHGSGEIEIVSMLSKVIGENPLLPASLITWTPSPRTREHHYAGR